MDSVVSAVPQIESLLRSKDVAGKRGNGTAQRSGGHVGAIDTRQVNLLLLLFFASCCDSSEVGGMLLGERLRCRGFRGLVENDLSVP